jgi:uncharacterized protein YndB with AHSA1/START domain
MSEYGTLVDPQTVRFERLLPGPIERVWEYLTDSEKRGTWLGAGAMDLRVGGKLVIVFDNNNVGPRPSEPPERYKQYAGVFESNHIVTAYDPPHRLAFTWDDDMNPAGSEVVFELKEEGKNVRLVLTHRRIADGNAAVNFSGGWHTHLAMLLEQLEGNPKTPFWTAFDGVEDEYRRRYSEK